MGQHATTGYEDFVNAISGIFINSRKKTERPLPIPKTELSLSWYLRYFSYRLLAPILSPSRRLVSPLFRRHSPQKSIKTLAAISHRLTFDFWFQSTRLWLFCMFVVVSFFFCRETRSRDFSLNPGLKSSPPLLT